MAGPYDYTSGNGFGQGLQLAGLFQQTQQQRAQAEQAERDRATALQFQQDWQSSFGDPQKMTALAAKYPGQMEAIKAGIGFQGEQHQADLGNAARDLRIAIATKNPQAVQAAAAKHAGVLATIGSSPEDIAQQFQSDPSSLSQVVDAVGMNALGAKDYYGVENDRTQRQQDQQKIEETARSNRASEAVQWANNNIAQQNVNLRRLELNDKKYDRQIANETNALKLADLQDKRQQNQQAIEQGKRDKADAYNTSMDALTRTVETAGKVLNSPGFTGYFGTNWNPLSNRWIPGTDAADTEALVDTLQSQGFLSGVQQMKGLGALSNAEGQKIMAAIGSLKPGQSEKSAKAAIKTIIDTTTLAKTRLSQRYGKDIQQYERERSAAQGGGQQQQQVQSDQQQPAQPGIQEGTTATNPKTGQKIVFRSGQWQPM